MLTEDQIKEKGFTQDQIDLISQVYKQKEADFSRLANENADGIFNGAAEKLTKLTGIPRNEKEKYSSYFERLGKEWLPEASKKKIQEAEKRAIEAEEKFKNHKGDETLKQELERLQGEVKKIPDLLKAKEDEWTDKYKKLDVEYRESKINRSISDSMPKFDDNVNPFELRAKKTNAIDRIKSNYELSYDENDNLIASKDYQKHLVSDLLKNDDELKDLILIEQNKGGGGSGGNDKKPKALNIPEGITKGAAQEIVRTYMKTVEGIDKLDPKYTDRFKELCKENNVL